MADEIKLKAPTVEQQVVVNISGEEKLRSFADTLEKISNNKNLQKYWKTQQELINATADAYGNFSKKASQDNAKELIKVTNALKAMSGTDLSNILPDFDKISKAMAEAQKVAGNIDSAFSVKGFKEAFDSFETLRAYGVDIQNLFSHFGVSSDVGELQKNVRALEGEVEKLTRRLTNAKNANEELRNEFENFKSGSGFADKLDELDSLKSEMSYIREEAEETFRQFLKLNNISEDGYDREGFYDDNRFREYFQNIQSGYMSASDAIRQFKTEYSYLLEESFKTNNDTFGLEQLQAFSNKLDSIFRQVEETSTKINDIISNGVITKSVENLSMDSSLSDSQRSLFGNLLQDEESLKSITALFQKLIEESNKTSKVDLFNDEQLQQVLSIFDKIEDHLSSLRSIISDIGDGEEFSPLLKMINNVQSSISELATSVKGIGLNMNIDLGSDSEMEAKVQSKIANALQAYQRLFDHIKMSSAGDSIINTNFFEFDINQYDTMMGKLQAYKKFIDNMRKEAKTKFNGKDVLYQDTEKSYWTQASAAMGQVTKAFNEMNAAYDTNPLTDMFGKTNLSEVIEQLGLIVAKLEEISTTASSFKNVFDNGFNVTASVEEIDKLTNRVKELEDELSKIKLNPVSVNKSNISSNSQIEDVFQGDKIDQATTSAKELDKALEQVNIPTDSFDDVLSKLDLTGSKLKEIVKITKQSVSDSEGKFHDSYTLKDKRGSTEIYGSSSNTEKGQLLRSNIVGYDAKAEAQEAKRLVEENIRLNKAYYDSKKQEEAEYQKLRAKYLAEGKAQEEKYYADLKKSRESTLKSYQSEIDSYKTKVANFEVKPDEGHSYDTWKNQIKELNSEIDKYQAKVNEVNKNGGIVDEKDEQEIKNIQKSLENMVRTMSKTSAGERGWTDIGASKTAEKIYSILEKNTKMSKSARDQIKAYYNEIRNGNPSAPLNEILDKCIKIEQKEREMGRAGKSWLDIFKDKKIYSFLGQAASMFSFYDLIRYGREGIDTIREFDDGLTKISYTMDITKSQLNDLGKSVLDMANDLDSSINNAMQVSQIYANMNTSAEEIKKLSEPTLILSNLTGFDASTVADDIQAVTQQFNIAAEDSMHIADVYDQISRNISVDYSKGIESIAEAVQVAGSTADQAGLSFEQLASIVGKTVEKTRLEGSQVGNGLKTIMTRLSKVGELSEEVDNETLSQASESLKKVGIEVYNLDGSYRQFDVIMGELASKWDSLTDAEKSNISFNIAATRQTNLLSAVLSNFSDSMQLAEEATNANGNALENNQKWVDSFGGHLQSLENTAKSAWINILDSETIKGGVDILNSLLKVVVGLIDKFGVLGSAAIIGGGILGKQNLGKTYECTVFKLNCFEYALYA